MTALNLSLEAGHAPTAVGSPTAIVGDTSHVFYRTIDGTIIDMFDDAGIWRRMDVGYMAASDPTSYVDSSGQVAVSFRLTDGSIFVARLMNNSWETEIALEYNSITLDKLKRLRF